MMETPEESKVGRGESERADKSRKANPGSFYVCRQRNQNQRRSKSLNPTYHEDFIPSVIRAGTST